METKANSSVFTRSRFMGVLALSALGVAAILGGCSGGDAKDIYFELSTTSILQTHTVGGSPCPQFVGTFDITNYENGSVDYEITVPDGLKATPSTVTIDGNKKATVTVTFTCTKTPPLSGTINVRGELSGDRQMTSTESISVNIVKG